MKTTYNFLKIAAFLIVLASCKTAPDRITNTEDYNVYLEAEDVEILQLAKGDYRFWVKKLEEEPGQFPYLVKAAASQSLLFNETGNIEHLIAAEQKLIAANESINYTKAGYLRALARNYISQHKFKESLELLMKAEINGENLNATQKMLFDVHLELGNTQKAKNYLVKIQDYYDFDYLIRESKWSDHQGDLGKAILYLKKASEKAESTNNKTLMQWSYTNLADYYGHDGQIQESYSHYLKALKLNPNDAYAKKGIAWIVYSHERNPVEAMRILDSIFKTHNAPDNYLLKAEIAKYMGDKELNESFLKSYLAAIGNDAYGDMYNKYKVILYAEDLKQTSTALKIAYLEIKNRPTPQSYDLLAWTHYNHGDIKDALKIMENHVLGKTFEPEAMYHLAHIYKANGKLDEAKSLKKELLKNKFELGPLMEQKINQI